jgi:hypothetical protein
LGAAHERALDFGNVSGAAKFSFKEKLPDMEIILRYDSCDGEIPLPVLPEWCLFQGRALRPVADPAPPSAPHPLCLRGCLKGLAQGGQNAQPEGPRHRWKQVALLVAKVLS